MGLLQANSSRALPVRLQRSLTVSGVYLCLAGLAVIACWETPYSACPASSFVMATLSKRPSC